jgi:hypothetical protein
MAGIFLALTFCMVLKVQHRDHDFENFEWGMTIFLKVPLIESCTACATCFPKKPSSRCSWWLLNTSCTPDALPLPHFVDKVK